MIMYLFALAIPKMRGVTNSMVIVGEFYSLTP